MERFQPVLIALRKYHFWALCAVVVGVGIMAWWTAAGSLSKEIDRRRGALDGKFNALQRVSGEPSHPNDGVVEAIEEKTEKLKGGVFQAWNMLYQEQKEKNPLPKVLGEDFNAMFESLGPEEEIPDRYREWYQNRIEEHIPTLFEFVDVIRPKDLGQGKAGHHDAKKAPEEEDEKIGTVAWNDADRTRLEDRFKWGARPSTLQVRLAQENLWVYEALVRIIKNTNKIGDEDATTNRDAAIKRIEALEIAQDAVDSWGKVQDPVVIVPAAAAAETGSSRRGSARPSDGGEPADGALSAEEAELLANRYVDNNGNPLEADEEPPYAEYEIMPIRMKFVMDQTKIPKLLVECANSEMPIEVKRLRMWPGEGDSSLDLSQPGEAAPRALKTRSPVADYWKRPIAQQHAASDASETETSDLDIPVEIEGVIYIYNPPDLDKVGTGAAADKTDAEPAEPPGPDSTESSSTQAPPPGPPNTASAAAGQVTTAAG